MKKKEFITAFFVVVVVIVLFSVIGVFMFQNSQKITMPQTGLLYYDDSEHENTLCYDFATGKVQEMQVDGYDNIINYRPLSNGFYCLSYVVSEDGNEDWFCFVYDIGHGVKQIRLPDVYASDLQFDGKKVYFIGEYYIESVGLQHALYAMDIETGQVHKLVQNVTDIFLCANQILYLQGAAVFAFDGQTSKKLVDTQYFVKQSENSFLFVKDDMVYAYSLSDDDVSKTGYDATYFPFLCTVGDEAFLRTNLKQSYIEKKQTEPETAYSIWPDKYDFVRYYLIDSTGRKTELKFLRYTEIDAPYFTVQ